jgi:fermentation-respiration switch protein FrsA (DUF1100 family)
MAGLGNVLILHGDADETVPRSHADDIYHLANDPKKLLIFPKGDHRMGNPADQQAFVNAATLWFESLLLTEIK